MSLLDVETLEEIASDAALTFDDAVIVRTPTGFETFAELKLYCYRVASAVGLASIHVWGFSSPRASRSHRQWQRDSQGS